MVNCPYLIYETSHCAGCTGWSCTVFGRKKRLSDTSMCVVNEEWIECPRYTTKIGTVKEPDPIPVVSVKGIGVLLPPGEIPEAVAVERAASAPPPGDDCPYLAPDPPGATCCSGFHCRAANVSLRAFKICKVPPYHECQRYQKAVRQGVT